MPARAAPIIFRRRAVGLLALLLATIATGFGIFWLAWILWTTADQRHRRAEAPTRHPDDAAAGVATVVCSTLFTAAS